jgi:hypothetical protein
MKVTSLNLPKYSVALAVMLGLLLALNFGGVARAATVSAPQATSSALCLTGSPANQQVVVGQTAQVLVTVNCLPPQFPSYVSVAWGDSTSLYYLCIEACKLPPLLVEGTHAYTAVGTYSPNICIDVPQLAEMLDCTKVEIIVT